MNWPCVTTVKRSNRVLFIVVNQFTQYRDGMLGNGWWLYDEDGKNLSCGYSKGRDGGWDSTLMATKNAKAAARRWFNKNGY